MQESGELSAADVQLLQDHPDIVEDLDGYKEFVAIYAFDHPAFAQYAADVTGRPLNIVTIWARREAKKLEKNYPGGWFK